MEELNIVGVLDGSVDETKGGEVAVSVGATDGCTIADGTTSARYLSTTIISDARDL
jgi:hypothetical protein